MSRENVEIVRVRLRRRHGEVVDDRQVLGRDRAAVGPYESLVAASGRLSAPMCGGASGEVVRSASSRTAGKIEPSL